MKSKFLSLITCITLTANCMGFYTNAETAQDISPKTIDLTEETSIKNIHGSNQYIETIELYEGEKIQLLLPDMDDINYVAFYSNNNKAAISHNLILTGYCAGEDTVSLNYEYGSEKWGEISLKVKVLKSDLPDEARAELERLNSYTYTPFLRRQVELAGGLEENAPRLTLDKVKEILSTAESSKEIYMQFNKYNGYPDIKPVGSANTPYIYWLDNKGIESVELIMEDEAVFYGKVAEDGTVTAVQILYPEKYATELITPEDNRKDYYYIKFHQLDTIGTGTVNVKFLDGETGEEFTDDAGTFQLLTDYNTVNEKVVKSWDVSEGSEITITDLSKEKSYELRYIDKSAGEDSDEGVYIVDANKGAGRFSFGLNDELELTVYMDKFYHENPYLLGDVNGDKNLNITDLVTFRNYLMGRTDTALVNWRAADICRDNVLDVFDLCRMKNLIINK